MRVSAIGKYGADIGKNEGGRPCELYLLKPVSCSRFRICPWAADRASPRERPPSIELALISPSSTFTSTLYPGNGDSLGMWPIVLPEY
jgi:hypothetical protein